MGRTYGNWSSASRIDQVEARPARSHRPGWSGWKGQAALYVGAYGVYNVARWLFVGELAVAREHAHWIERLEQHTGVAVESSVQHSLSSPFASFILGNAYMAAQLVVLPGSLIWLYRHSPQIYRTLRNTVVATWLIAVPIYALYPVAPPRLAEAGMVDTVSHQAGFALTGRSTLFYNPLAAVPSLHVGFAVAIGIAIAAALRRPWAKGLALLWGPTVGLAVIATGNHYVFDIAAGLVVTAVGYLVGQVVARRLADAAGASSPIPMAAAGPRLAGAGPRTAGGEGTLTSAIDDTKPTAVGHNPA
jgi:hypothetical protein